MTRERGRPPLGAVGRPTTLADEVYMTLRSALADGRFDSGEVLTERGLARELDVSPTPVREALRRLEQEGMVERDANRSLRVSALFEMPLDELLLIEARMRGVAARLASAKLSEAEAEELARAIDRAGRLGNDPIAQLDSSQRVHALINEASRNALLVRTLDVAYTIRRHMRSEKVLAEVSPEQLRERHDQHVAIAEAVMSGDGESAEQLTVEHTLSAGRVLFRGTDDEV